MFFFTKKKLSAYYACNLEYYSVIVDAYKRETMSTFFLYSLFERHISITVQATKKICTCRITDSTVSGVE